MKKNLIIIMALCVLTIGAQAQTWVNLGSVELSRVANPSLTFLLTCMFVPYSQIGISHISKSLLFNNQ